MAAYDYFTTNYLNRVGGDGGFTSAELADFRLQQLCLGDSTNPITKFLKGSKTYDPQTIYAPSADTGTGVVTIYSTSTTVTVTGAALGDSVIVSFSKSLAGVTLSAYVSAADTVTCVFSGPNLTDTVDLDSGTLKVGVFSF